MKCVRRNTAIGAVVLSVVMIISSTVDANAGSMDMAGFMSLDKRLLINDGFDNGDTLAKARLEYKGDMTSKLFLLGGVEIRRYDFPQAESLPAQEEVESGYPTDILPWEFYVEYTGLFDEEIDIKVGRQRIAWGAADQFNPTDNLNPYDFTDFLDFGAKTPSWAIKADYLFGEYILTGVVQPLFESTLLQKGGAFALFGQDAQGVETPSSDVNNFSYAAKLSGVALNFDYSLSYFRGYDTIPILLGNENGDRLGFFEIEVFGFDISGELAAVGVWGEFALFIPGSAPGESAVGMPDGQYTKYTVGMDYTFPNGVYLQGQLIYGFFTERGEENLHDYFMGVAEKRFFNDTFTVTLAVVLEKPDSSGETEEFANGFLPKVTYALMDDVELSIGAAIFDGPTDTILGAWKDQDQVFAKIRYAY